MQAQRPGFKEPTGRSHRCWSFTFHTCSVLLLSPSHKPSPGPLQTPGGPSGPRDPRFTFHSTQRRAQAWKPAFVYFGRVREGGDAQAEPRLGRRQASALRPPTPGLGSGKWEETERGSVTKRRRNAEAAAPTPRALSEPQTRLRLSRLGPASAGRRALRPWWAQPLSRRRLGRRKASRESALAPEGRARRRRWRRRGYKRERGGGRRKWAVRRRLVLLFGVWASGGAFSGGPPVQAALTGPLSASLWALRARALLVPRAPTWRRRCRST